MVKEREDVNGPFLQGPSEDSDLGQADRDSMGEFNGPGLHLSLAHCGVGLAVGSDHLLVDAPGGLVVARSVDRCRRGGYGGPGTRDRRPGSGCPWSSCWTRRRHWSRASRARRTAWNGSITAVAVGTSSLAAVLNPVNPSIATTSTPSRHALNTALERPSTMSSNLTGPIPDPDRGQVNDHGDALVTAGGMASHMFVNTDGDDPRSSIKTRLPSARAASLAVFHDTANAPRSEPRSGAASQTQPASTVTSPGTTSNTTQPPSSRPDATRTHNHAHALLCDEPDF